MANQDKIIELSDNRRGIAYPDGTWKIEHKIRLGWLPVDGGVAASQDKAVQAIRRWERDN